VTPVRHNTIETVDGPSAHPAEAVRAGCRSAHRRSGGAVRTTAVVEGFALLARKEGIFAETLGGVTVATAKKLVESGKLGSRCRSVLLITGDV